MWFAFYYMVGTTAIFAVFIISRVAAQLFLAPLEQSIKKQSRRSNRRQPVPHKIILVKICEPTGILFFGDNGINND